MMMNNDRAMMLKKVQAASFALDDIQLFLDTHPNDRAALECFAKYQKIYKELCAEFEEKYGALKAKDVDTNKGWTWVMDPWPWEMEAND